jgi:putative ABC transport system ATP-binding protein
MSDRSLFSIRDLMIRRGSGPSAFELHVPKLDIARGERIALVGSSGCGKSTLLDILSMISLPVEVGHFQFSPPGAEATDVGALLGRPGIHDRLSEIRKRSMGYVLQTGGLLSFLSVEANIGISRRLLGMQDRGEVRAMAAELQIDEHLQKRPDELSVGQRQRVAIARALAHQPALVIADEPTAALDPRNADRVMELFLQQVEKRGATLIVASHDLDRVERFGLRCLTHGLEETGQGLIRATFQG